jgi:hypothetical protein
VQAEKVHVARPMKITRFAMWPTTLPASALNPGLFCTDLPGLPEVPVTFPGRLTVMGSDLGFRVEQAGGQMHIIGVEKQGISRKPANTVELQPDALTLNT